MDSSDHATSPSGYLRIDMDLAEDVGALRVWAWRGPSGAVYDDNTRTAAVHDVRTLGVPTALEVTDDMRPTARKLRLGDTVTFTFRLVDANGDPVPKPGVEFSVSTEQSKNGRTAGPRTISRETGPHGTAELMVRNPDPNPKDEDLGDIAQLDLDVLDFGTLEVIDRTTVGLLTNDGAADDRLLDWSDEMPVITTLTLTVPEDYLVASSAEHRREQPGGGPPHRPVRLGIAGRGERITFTSSDPSVTPNNTTRTANVGGNATFTYHRDSAIRRHRDHHRPPQCATQPPPNRSGPPPSPQMPPAPER